MSTMKAKQTLRLNVPGITCDGGVMTIRMAVGRVQGVNKVSGEAKSRTLTVEYEPSTVTVEAIQEALKRVGYDDTTLAGTAPGVADPSEGTGSGVNRGHMMEAYGG